MNFSRIEDKAAADSFKLYSDITRYLRVIVDIYSSSEIDRIYWLTDREKDFFVATVILLSNKETNPTSKEAIQIYKKYFSPAIKKVNINDYINKLKKKGWLKYNKLTKAVEIPAIFLDIGEESDVIDFNLRYAYTSRNEQDA